MIFLVLLEEGAESFPSREPPKKGRERKAVGFTPGGKEQELLLTFAECECPALCVSVPAATPPAQQRTGGATNATATELQEGTRPPSTHWSEVEKN